MKRVGWKKSGYIDDLLVIEDFALGKGRWYGWTAGYRIKGLETKYPKQCAIIREEISPGFKKRMAERKKIEAEKQKREEREQAEEEKIVDKMLKEDWLKAIGKKPAN